MTLPFSKFNERCHVDFIRLVLSKLLQVPLMGNYLSFNLLRKEGRDS